MVTLDFPFKNMYLLYLRFVLLVMCLSPLSIVVDCADDPLKLTPYLNTGKIKEAQEKALVTPDMNGVKSYSGYFTVNEDCGSNLFFWFFPSEKNWETAPVLLWLNGGPGSTSLFGMFIEIGPFNHVTKKGFVNNEYSWTKGNNVIFLDQPVDVGFSFTEKECYADNLTAVAQDAYSALIQFFTLFPNLQENRFFLTGESYAGHYIPAIASEVHHRNQDAPLKINMVGFMIGNPWIDARCVRTALYMYELGFIDENVRDQMEKYEQDVFKLIDEKNYSTAYDLAGAEFGLITDPPSYHNILYDKSDDEEFDLFIRRYNIRKQIHVGNIAYNMDSNIAKVHLAEARYTPVTPIIQEVLETNKYIVGFYSGNLDISCMYTSVPCALRQMKWHGSAEYLAASRNQWWVDGRLAGWFKTAGNLFEVVVSRSGHYVPTDDGRAALVLLTAVTADNPGFKLLTKLNTRP